MSTLKFSEGLNPLPKKEGEAQTQQKALQKKAIGRKPLGPTGSHFAAHLQRLAPQRRLAAGAQTQRIVPLLKPLPREAKRSGSANCFAWRKTRIHIWENIGTFKVPLKRMKLEAASVPITICSFGLHFHCWFDKGTLSLTYGHGSKPRLAPSERFNPTTKIGPKMGGEFTYPKKAPLVLNHGHMSVTESLCQTNSGNANQMSKLVIGTEAASSFILSKGTLNVPMFSKVR